MGNAITKKYEVPKDYTASAGHLQLWKIWPGKSKETGKEVSIWVFDKTEFSKRKSSNSASPIDKAIVEQVFQIMRKDLSLLREICSVSGGVGNIVQYIETVEESSTALIFTSERILCSLADLQCGFEGIPPSPKLEEIKMEYFNTGSDKQLSFGLSDIEISRGLLNAAEGLQYLHTVQRKLHLNLTPESIIITPSGLWKLCGLGFALGFQQGERQQLPSPYFLQSVPHTIRLEPDLRYCGPEITTGGFNPPSIRYLSSSSDVFSLGIVAFETYRYNLDTSFDRKTTVVPMSNNSAAYHQAALENISRVDFKFLSSPVLAQLIRDMVTLIPSSRITIPNIMNHSYFSSGPLQVLKLIDSLRNRDIGTQSSQLLTLPSQLSSLPLRLLEGTILPSVCAATMANVVLMTYAIPTHVYISQRISKSKYISIAGQSVIHAFENNTSVEVMQSLLKNMAFFANIFSPEGSNPSQSVSTTSIEPAMVTLITNCLDKPQTSVHIAGFQILCDEKIRSYITSQNIVSKIVPKVCREACKNSDPNVKIHALYVLSLISSRLDKGYIIQNILPSLKYITDNEKNPVVSMCVLGNYNKVATVLGPDYIARNIVPSVSPMLVDRSLDKKQFELVGHLLRSLLFKVYELRAAEIGLSGSGSSNLFFREESNTDIDPFYAAKIMIQNAKKDTESDNQISDSVNGINSQFTNAAENNLKPTSAYSSQLNDKSMKSDQSEETPQSKSRLVKVKKLQPSEVEDPIMQPSMAGLHIEANKLPTPPAPILPSPSLVPSIPLQNQYHGSLQQFSYPPQPLPHQTIYPTPQQQQQIYPQQTFLQSQPQYNQYPSPIFNSSNTIASQYQQPTQTQPFSMGTYGQALSSQGVTNTNPFPASSNPFNTNSNMKKSDDPFDFLS